MKNVRVAVMAAVVCVMGCAGKSTPVGPLGPVLDLRPLLPEAVRAKAPADAAAVEHRAEVTAGEPAAKVAVTWRTFTDGPSSYIVSMGFEVVAAAEGVALEAGRFGEPVNRGTAEAVMQSVLWQIVWNNPGAASTRGGTVTGDILADGTLHTN